MRPGQGGAGTQRPGITGGGTHPRPGGGDRRPGIAGGGTRPGQGGPGDRWPGIAGGGNRPGPGGGGRWPGIAGGGTRPGQGGSGERWPGIGGGGTRPGQGGSGERWPGFAGGGNHPGWRPGDRWPGGGGERPGWRPGDRWPGTGGNRPGIGNGNIGQIGDNLGIANRPNYGNNLVGNSFQGGNNYNINNSYSSGYNYAPTVAGNVGGGYGWGGGGGGYGWGGGGYGGYGGWASPYYGNWYRGNFGSAGSFWSGFGLGALSSFGLGSLYGAGGYGYGYGYGGYPYGGNGYSTVVYSAFPTWGMSNYSGWGLGSVATDWLYSDYTNPYYAAAVAAQPVANAAVVYDYSQPINVAAAPPDPSVTDSTEQVFSAARDSFKAGDYPRALDLADQVLKQTPNAAVVHEFRALALFALKRYDEAAAVAYAVLSAGPGWNWTTLTGLYPNVDTYTNQLRALEAYVTSNPASPNGRFLLAYHYMVQGHNEQAAAQFAQVVKLAPGDQLSASFAKVLRTPSDAVAQAPPPAAPDAAAAAPAQAPPGGPAPDQAATPAAPPPPPAALAGSWKAQPAPDVAVALTLAPDGGFVWDVDAKGQKQKLEGQAAFQDGTLTLMPGQGPPLAGKVTQNADDSFTFAPPGAGAKGGGLVFRR
jgi:tetratricopeptide (TPR) repeat protein